MLSTMFAAFLAMSSLTSVVTSLPLGQLIVGRSAGLHDVVIRGEYNLEIGNQNPWRTHLSATSSIPALPDTKFYFTLQANATGGVTSTTVRLQWATPLGDSAHFIAGTRNSWGNWNDTVTLNVNDPPGTYWFEFFPPTGSPIADDMPDLPWTGCSNAQDGEATGLFSIHLDDPNYDNVDFATTTKDCTWPAIGFGEDTASILRQVDIIEPNRLSNTPNLRSRPSVMFQINGNNPTRSVVMTSQVRLGTWAAESQAYYAVAPADTSSERVQLVLDSEIPAKGVVTTGYADAKPLRFVQLTFRALCLGSAIWDREFSTIEVPVYIGFSRPWVLAIFNVTCTPESVLVPFGTLNVTVQQTETINPDFTGWEVIKNGRVTPLFTPGGKLADFVSQQLTMNFLFQWKDPTANNAIFSSKFNVQALSGSGVTRGSVVELRNDRNNDVISQSRAYQWPNSGTDSIYSFPLKMQLNCPNQEATVAVWQVSIENLQRVVGANTVQYSPIQFRFTFPCNWPKFALSTINNGANTAWDLYSNGLPILGTTGNREVINKVVVAPMTDTVITTYLSDHQLTDVIYFYQQPDANIINREFTWSLAPSQNLQDAVVEMDGQSMNDNRSHTISWRAPEASVLQELRITRFTCQAKGTVRLETWLRFGYTAKVQLIWERVCTNNIPDDWDNGSSNSSSSLDDGAIFGIIVAVLFAVGCLIGVCYNSIKLGKTGLSVIPGMDSFNAWNDGVKAPNRYSTDISQKASKSKVADVEIHSLGYGSYQQSDDGYVDEIDTL